MTLHPWRNAAKAGDVNNDGQETALDALLIINDISRHSRRELPVLAEGIIQLAYLFLDVSGDNSVSSLDALRVINEVGRQSPGSGEFLVTASSTRSSQENAGELPAWAGSDLTPTRKPRLLSTQASPSAPVPLSAPESQDDPEDDAQATDQALRQLFL